MQSKATLPGARASSTARGYGYKWQQASKGFLKKHPLCACPHCASASVPLQATLVDHIIPHRGDMALFWNRSNWQPLNDECHNSYKQRLEKTGTIAGCNSEGMPLDPSHHWRDALQ